MLQITTVKQYLKIEDDLDDEIINLIINAVKQYIKNNTNIDESIEFPADLQIAAMNHVAFLYENRGNSDVSIPKSVQNIYLKYKNISI